MEMRGIEPLSKITDEISSRTLYILTGSRG